jgi:hypothetical protein
MLSSSEKQDHTVFSNLDWDARTHLQHNVLRGAARQEQHLKFVQQLDCIDGLRQIVSLQQCSSEFQQSKTKWLTQLWTGLQQRPPTSGGPRAAIIVDLTAICHNESEP